MLKISSKRQLFLDDHIIGRMDNVHRVLHQPEKHPENPVLVPEYPWEGIGASPHMAIYDEEEGITRLWYTCHKNHDSLPGFEDLSKVDGIHGKNAVEVPGLDIRHRKGGPWSVYSHCYATSTDGVHFEKPPLGLVPFPGTDARTNLCPHKPAMHDPDDPDPEKRFKAVIGTGDSSERMGISWSPDGLHWTDHPDNPVLDKGLGAGRVIWEESLNQYVGYFRPMPWLVYPERGPRGIRVLGRSTSPDFIQWTLPQDDVVLVPDDQDDTGIEFYNMALFKYEDCYIGFLWIYYNYTHTGNSDPITGGRPSDAEGLDKLMDSQLAFSRDGHVWTRVCDRQLFMGCGKPGNWDEMEIHPSGMVERDGELKIYYTGRIDGHGQRKSRVTETIVEGREVTGAVGLATLRLDGFVSVNAGKAGGELMTRPFDPGTGEKIFMNANAPKGRIAVEVLDQYAEPLEGFAREVAIPFTGDAIDYEVQWKERSALEGLNGSPIRLRFVMKNAELYSFRIGS